MVTEITTPLHGRSITTTDNDEEQYLTVSVTQKEAVDLYNALTELVDNTNESHPDYTDREAMLHMTIGGMDILRTTSVLIEAEKQVEILLEALEQHQPVEADFTERLQTAILDAVERPPLEFNTDPLRAKYIND